MPDSVFDMPIIHSSVWATLRQLNALMA